jgi:hypothetical protein
MEHPTLGTFGVSNPPPGFKLRRDLDRQTSALEDPFGSMVLRRTFSKIHTIRLETHIARKRQAADRAGLRDDTSPREGDAGADDCR